MELMIVVAIVAILAAVTVPSYGDYVRRAKIVEAAIALSEMRSRMEQYFLDNRTYSNGAECGVDQTVVSKSVQSFTVACGIVDTGYVVTATGVDSKGMKNFAYTIDQANSKVTKSVPLGWNTPNPNRCWAVRKDGSCG